MIYSRMEMTGSIEKKIREEEKKAARRWSLCILELSTRALYDRSSHMLTRWNYVWKFILSIKWFCSQQVSEPRAASFRCAEKRREIESKQTRVTWKRSIIWSTGFYANKLAHTHKPNRTHTHTQIFRTIIRTIPKTPPQILPNEIFNKSFLSDVLSIRLMLIKQ